MAVCSARTASSQLPVVFCGAKCLADWQLDDAGGDKLADLPADRFRDAAGIDRLCGTNSAIHSGADRRSLGGSVGSTQGADLDAGAFDGAVVLAGGTRAHASHHVLGHLLA